MLTKVSHSDIKYGTYQIQEFYKNNTDIDLIQDNLHGQLLIKNKSNKTYLFDYNKNKYYSHNTIHVHWKNNIIIKHIISFDQNNSKIANQIRNYVLKECLTLGEINCVLGIGGEYYIYFPYISSKIYYGISNHPSIIIDANNNIPYSSNCLVDYNSIKVNLYTSPDLIIVNVFNIHENIISWIKKFKFLKLIIIACNLSDSKLKLLDNSFKIKKIKYFKNYSSWIRIIHAESL